jgi:hypothetical protein
VFVNPDTDEDPLLEEMVSLDRDLVTDLLLDAMRGLVSRLSASLAPLSLLLFGGLLDEETTTLLASFRGKWRLRSAPDESPASMSTMGALGTTRSRLGWPLAMR